ncbi:uncharacterized protein MELLADRAFT_105290 [Melampsora larici-populina 98AG31]|uniref:Uncharacterized protein n=1 Tax=Melampsora larici-populina (strain 98AG31 / pathotype 3-4-7) TaxID=747676 RepID=F4RHM1_MELLP|nr:uncharacterized protein MELLADRAFT_105290 [Melampsora larici-populina 98AG31]EGG08112.1 hypothetical protein MELLADRAFT_105290 [Melampsora larici-populina 98AG31]
MPKPRSPRRTLPSKPYSKPPKRTPHLPEKFKPQKPGHQFDNCYNINSRVDQYVRQMLFEVKAEVIDYDLAVANFLFETSHLALPDIPRSVEIVLNDFDVLFPLVSRDHDVLTCALQIQSTLNLHRQNPSTTTKPFALLFPNINSLKKLISERSKSPRVLESEKAIVLVDLEGRFLAMGLPPSPKYKKQTENQKSCPHKPDNHLPKADDDSPEGVVGKFPGICGVKGGCSREERGVDDGDNDPTGVAARGAELEGREAEDGATTSCIVVLRSLHSMMKDNYRSAESTTLGGIDKAIVGVTATTLCWLQPNARPDRKIQLGFDRQGYNLDDLGDWPTSDSHLPVAMGLGEESLFMHTDNAHRLQELHWAYEVSRVVNASVQPETYKIAEDVVKFVAKNSGPFVSERLERSHNRIIHGQHVNHNNQVAPHRDGKNCNLIDSVFAYGRDYAGGRWLFASLGVSLCTDPGYSVHAFFKYLDHAVDTILPTSEKPPLRISLALYSHADVYSGPARVAGARVGKYNDSSKVTNTNKMVFWYQSIVENLKPKALNLSGENLATRQNPCRLVYYVTD